MECKPFRRQSQNDFAYEYVSLFVPLLFSLLLNLEILMI